MKKYLIFLICLNSLSCTPQHTTPPKCHCREGYALIEITTNELDSALACTNGKIIIEADCE